MFSLFIKQHEMNNENTYGFAGIQKFKKRLLGILKHFSGALSWVYTIYYWGVFHTLAPPARSAALLWVFVKFSNIFKWIHKKENLVKTLTGIRIKNDKLRQKSIRSDYRIQKCHSKSSPATNENDDDHYRKVWLTPMQPLFNPPFHTGYIYYIYRVTQTKLSFFQKKGIT